MTDQHPTTEPPVFGEGFRRKLIDWALASALGFGSAWIYSEVKVNDLQNKVIRLEEKERHQSAIEAKRATDELQNAREMERLAGSVKAIADRQQEMREERRR